MKSYKNRLWNPNCWTALKILSQQAELTHILDRKHMRNAWVKVHCTSTYGNILCGGGWLESNVHMKTCFDTLFSHYALKLSGWGSSGKRRKRRDWSRFQCLLNQKVRKVLVLTFVHLFLTNVFICSSSESFFKPPHCLVFYGVCLHWKEKMLLTDSLTAALLQEWSQWEFWSYWVFLEHVFAFPLRVSSSGFGVSPGGRRPAAGFLSVPPWLHGSEGTTQHAGRQTTHLSLTNW